MKTVYILGAGFSIQAGAPSQAKIVEKIFEKNRAYSSNFTRGSIRKFRNFLTNTLLIPAKFHKKVPLEDIFTPLDRCIADNISFRNLNVADIIKTRENIYYLIGRTLELLLPPSSNKNYIDEFANYLVDRSKHRMRRKQKKKDLISVISTNWDVLLDNSIQAIINKDFKDQAVVDYCCYISSYGESDKSVKPGLQMLGEGGFNIKLLKLHGSLNWLQCPRCSRVYITFEESIAIRHIFEPINCRHCDNNFGNTPDSHNLSSNLIMPTFLKDFTNPQYKLIWQNAGIELSEADRIVFIGYSLPQADFEMRQLLARMVKDDAKIEVVSYGKETDRDVIDLKKRFSVFFGRRETKFHWCGAESFIQNEIMRPSTK